MAANNLRIIYDNQVDYTNSTITASSTATTSTVAANLKNDTRSVVWRSVTTTGPNPAVIIKSATSSAATGVHSNLTLSTLGTGTPPTLYYTLTTLGGTEVGPAVAGATTTVVSDTAAITGYVLRTYNSPTVSAGALVDYETVPVVFSAQNTVTVALSNDFHRLPTTADGVTTITYTNSGTNIYAYDGSTPLRYSDTVTSAGVYRVVASGSSITPGAISTGLNGAFATGAQHASMLAVPTATVTYTVAGKTWANTSFTSTIVQTVVKSLTVSTDSIYSTLCTSTVARAQIHLALPLTTNTVESAVLTYTNLSRGSTIRVLGYGAATISLTGTSDTPVINTANTAILNTDHILCCPFTSAAQASWTNLSYGTVTWGLDRQTARVWIPSANWAVCRNVVLDIVDPNSADRYIEASKLICGEYWSPTYNTEYGLSVGLQDDSENLRSESGNLITTNGVVYKTLSFNLNYLTTTDRNEMVKLLRNNGKRRGVFISLFPSNSEDWEQESLYQLYGKLSSGLDLSHPYYQYFSTSIQLEEI